jgi:putative sigma-54 modulation protein
MNMKITIASPHFIVTEKLETYTMEMAAKLSHLDARLVRCDVLLKIDNSSTNDNKVCEMNVAGDKKKLFASSRSNTFEEAIANVIHELENQLRKQKVLPRRDGEKMEIDTDNKE